MVACWNAVVRLKPAWTSRRLAGLTPAGVICEVMQEDGTMMRLDDLATFAAEHKLHIISVEQLVQFRLASGQGNMATAHQ